MNDIDLLEHGGGPFHVRFAGETIALPDPRDMHYQNVLLCLHIEQAPGVPQGVPMWQWPAIFDRWRAAWDLPDFNVARRLAYLVDHYRAALSHDLLVHAGLDLGEEWRARRWRRLSDVIDRLPGHSHFSAAIANDEEYAEMAAKAAAERGDTKPGAGGDSGPSLTGWSPEVAMLAKVVDAVNQVRYATIAVQAGKKAGDPPKPERRPQTALEKAFRRAEHDRRKAAHEALVARVLPKKRQS
jgi:hypothetical protein